MLRQLEVALKPHLRPNGSVVPPIEMLTYFRVRSACNTRDALMHTLIYLDQTCNPALAGPLNLI